MKYSIGAIIAVMVIVAASAFLTAYILPRHWNGSWTEKESRAWSMLPYSPEVKRGISRLMPLITVTSWGFSWLGIGGFIDEVFGFQSDAWAAIFYIPGAAMMLAFFPLGYFVIYRNIPKALIAPHYRGDIGATEFRRRNGSLRKTRFRAAFLWMGFVLFILAIVIIGILNR